MALVLVILLLILILGGIGIAAAKLLLWIALILLVVWIVGFIVFFANPSGSKGYGREFCAAIQGAWGTVDWQDVQAVTAFMKDHPRVDALRLGVMGGSYGGYMTTWAIGHTHDFAAAITDRSVSNVVSLGATSSDFMFSTTCSGRLAPVITELTLGFFMHHASESCPGVQPSSFAIGTSARTLPIFS